jgi:hypothetical protein
VTAPASAYTPSPEWSAFRDYPGNPLIEPHWPEWIIADPTVLPPELTPDGRWHLFANGLRGIYHFTSADGLAWTRGSHSLFGGMRPCVRRIGDRFLLFYEHYLSLRRSVVELRTSSDLVTWSTPRIVLEPSMAWEGRIPAVTGNPCLVEGRSGFLLYYSAGAVFLRDCLFIEPRYIGVAEGGLAGGAVSQAGAADPVALERRSVSQPRGGRDQGLPRRRRLRRPPERDLPGRGGRDRLGDPAVGVGGRLRMDAGGS